MPHLPSQFSSVEPPEPGLRDYLRILLKHRWTVLATVFIVVSAAAIISFRMVPQYRASSRIAITRDSGDTLGIKQQEADMYESSDDWDYTVALDTQIGILKSDALAAQVIRDLRLDENPQFAGKLARQREAVVGKVDVPTQQALIERFRAGLSVDKVPHTRLVEITFMHSSPQLAAAIANGIANGYIERNFKTRFETTMQTSDWLQQQLADLQVKVQTSEEKLVRYQKEHGILGIDEKQNIVTSKLDDLNKELTAAENDRIGKESLYRLSLSGDPELVRTAQHSELIDSLRARESDLKTQLAQASATFGPAYPKVQELKNQLDQVQSNITAEIQKIAGKFKTDYLAAAQREKMLRGSMEAQKQQANELNQNAIEYNLLKRDADASRQLYDGLLQKAKEAAVTAGLRSSNIHVVDTAAVPQKPAKPNIPQNLFLALMVGFIGGIALAFVQESLDNTVRTPEQVQALTALPAIGLIPMSAEQTLAHSNKLKQLPVKASAQQGRAELISLSRPRSEVAEAYRALRTSILLSASGNPPKVLLVSSALPQEGKTTTSVNTAVVLAQRGARVLLVDADMRRPSLHHVLGVSPKTGLSTLLAGRSTMKDVVMPAPGIPNLSVIPAGPQPPQPAELLGSTVMAKYIAEWREQYDHIVIDTPPVLSVTDAVLLSVQADSVMLVIRSGQTTKHALRRCREVLHHVGAHTMGVVVNAVDFKSPDYYYYGYNHYGNYYGNK